MSSIKLQLLGGACLIAPRGDAHGNTFVCEHVFQCMLLQRKSTSYAETSILNGFHVLVLCLPN